MFVLLSRFLKLSGMWRGEEDGLESQLPLTVKRTTLGQQRCTRMKTESNYGRFRRKRGRAGQFGAEVVEMAFALPILFMLLLGLFWFARAYNVYETMTRAAREGARVAVAPACSACAGGGQLPAIATVASAVNGSLVASSLDPTQVACGTCAGTCNGSAPAICYQSDVVLNTATTPTEHGVVVSFTYPFQFAIPFVTFTQNITLSTTVRMRQED